jgi:hypothetical protein
MYVDVTLDFGNHQVVTEVVDSKVIVIGCKIATTLSKKLPPEAHFSIE